MSSPGNHPDVLRNEDGSYSDRDGAMWEMYINGATQKEIANHFNTSQPAVSQAIRRVRVCIPSETREDVVLRNVALCHKLKQAMLKLVFADPVPAYSQGRPIVMPDGTPAMDHSGRLRAVDAVLKIMEREAKMLGLDAPKALELAAPLRVEMVGVDVDQI